MAKEKPVTPIEAAASEFAAAKENLEKLEAEQEIKVQDVKSKYYNKISDARSAMNDAMKRMNKILSSASGSGSVKKPVGKKSWKQTSAGNTIALPSSSPSGMVG